MTEINDYSNNFFIADLVRTITLLSRTLIKFKLTFSINFANVWVRK